MNPSVQMISSANLRKLVKTLNLIAAIVASFAGLEQPARQIMGRIAEVMQYCAGCRATYRLVEAP